MHHVVLAWVAGNDSAHPRPISSPFSIPPNLRLRNHFATLGIAQEIGVAGVSTSQWEIDRATSSIGNRRRYFFDVSIQAKRLIESE